MVFTIDADVENAFDIAIHICNDIQDYQTVISYSTQFLRVRPEDSYAYYVRGIANQNMDNIEMAISDLEEAKSLGNKEAEAVILNIMLYIKLTYLG